MSELNALTISAARDKLRAKEITAVDLTNACLDAGGDALNVFAVRTPESARVCLCVLETANDDTTVEFNQLAVVLYVLADNRLNVLLFCVSIYA